MPDSEFTELLSRYIDGDLDPKQREAVEQRLREDPEARRIHRELRITVDLVRSLEEADVPQGLTARILEDARRPSLPRRAWEWIFGGPLLSPARGLAVILLALVVGMVLYRSPQVRESIVDLDRKGTPHEATFKEKKSAESVAALDEVAPIEREVAVESVEDARRAAGIPRSTVEPAPSPPQPSLPTVALEAGGGDSVRTAADGRTESTEVRSRTRIPAPAHRIMAELVLYEPAGSATRRTYARTPALGSAPRIAEESTATGGEEPERLAKAESSKALSDKFNLRIRRMGPKGKTDDSEAEGATQPGREWEQDVLKFEAANVVREFRGSYSGVKQQRNVVVEDRAAWESLWKEMTSISEPAQPAPEVDFATQFVLAVFMGQRNTGGFSTTIEEIELAGGNALRVHVRERSPEPGQIVTMALTQPYHILILPRKIEGFFFDTSKGFGVEFFTQ